MTTTILKTTTATPPTIIKKKRPVFSAVMKAYFIAEWHDELAPREPISEIDELLDQAVAQFHAGQFMDLDDALDNPPLEP